MTVPENVRPGRGRWQCNKWAGAVALLIGSVTVVAALVLAAGMQLASSPSAVAGTTTATPWVIPGFAPPPARQPQSSVSSQGTVSGSAGGSAPSGGSDWSSKALPAYNDVAAGIQNVANSLNSQDIDGTKAACARLHDAGQRLGATLPSPVPALTSELDAAVAAVGTATTACASLGPGSGQAGLDAVTGPLKQAADHFNNAQRIAQKGG